MQQLHTAYSRLHNVRHGRSAHLFRAHFTARPITSDRDLLAVCRYIALNPVKACLVDKPLNWPWSSTRNHAGLDQAAIPLDETPLQAALDDDPNWRQRYTRLLEDA
jgi:putative transposase